MQNEIWCREGFMRVVYLVVGFVTLALGCVGLALPILPSTPFLLVAAFCFAKSSKKLDTWFKGTKIYKDNLESFAKGQGMTKKTKAKILTMVTILLGIAAFMMREVPYGFAIIGAVWLAHMIAFIFVVKTSKEDSNPR